MNKSEFGKFIKKCIIEVLTEKSSDIQTSKNLFDEKLEKAYDFGWPWGRFAKEMLDKPSQVSMNAGPSQYDRAYSAGYWDGYHGVYKNIYKPDSNNNPHPQHEEIQPEFNNTLSENESIGSQATVARQVKQVLYSELTKLGFNTEGSQPRDYMTYYRNGFATIDCSVLLDENCVFLSRYYDSEMLDSREGYHFEKKISIPEPYSYEFVKNIVFICSRLKKGIDGDESVYGGIDDISESRNSSKKKNIKINGKKLTLEQLVRENVIQVLKENLERAAENFDPQSSGPNIPSENPYPEWNNKMRQMEEEKIHNPDINYYIENSGLSEHEKLVIKGKLDGYNFSELGKQFNTTRGKIRRLFESAFKKIKANINKENVLENEHGRYAQEAGAGDFDPNSFGLNESMNVSIQGFKNDRRLDNLNDLSYYLLDTVVSPILKKLPPDQIEYFKKNSVGFYELITPDGSYHEGPGGSTGIINLYIAGIMSNTLQEILNGIYSELRKLNIQVGDMVKEKSGVYKSEVIRIPIIKNDNKYNGPPEMNLSNVNAYHIFHNILQYEGEHSFEMDAADLKQVIETLYKDKSWIDQNIRKTTISKHSSPEDMEGEEWKEKDQSDDHTDDENPHDKVIDQISQNLGATVIKFGLDANDIWERLIHIHSIADWALQHGYTKITVG